MVIPSSEMNKVEFFERFIKIYPQISKDDLESAWKEELQEREKNRNLELTRLKGKLGEF